MAFGGLPGIGMGQVAMNPLEILRNGGWAPPVNPSGIPFGPLNFHPSQMGTMIGGPSGIPGAPIRGLGSLMTGPAMPNWSAIMDPTGAAQAQGLDMRSVISGRTGPDPFTPGPRYRGSLPGPGAPAAPPSGAGAPAAVGRSQAAAQRVLQSLAGRGPSGSPIPLGPGTTPSLGRIPYAQGAVSSLRPGANMPVNAGQLLSQAQARVPGASALPTRIPGATLRGAASGAARAVPEAAVSAVDDLVRGVGQMALPGIPAAAAGAGTAASSALPRIAGAVPGQMQLPFGGVSGVADDAGRSLFQRLLPTVANAGGWRGLASRLGSGGMLSRLGGSGLGARGARGIGMGVLDNLAIQPIAEQIGDNPAGQFLSGFGTGATLGGFGRNPIGMAVGGVGVGLGNVLSNAILPESWGNDVSDIEINGWRPFGGGEETSALDTAVQQVQDSGDPMAPQITSAMRKFAENDDSVWQDLGLDGSEHDEIRGRIVEDFNNLAGDASQEERTALLQQLTANALTASQAVREQEAMETEGQAQFDSQGIDANSILAAQALGSQFMAPIAADAAAIGEMGQDALTGLAQGLPPELRGNVQDLAGIMGQNGGQMANAYMQQAFAVPQVYAMDQQQQMTNQIASMLQQQAIQSLPQFAQPASSGGTIEDLLAGQALGGGMGGGTGIEADLAAMMQAG
jgi:hypothetical protein